MDFRKPDYHGIFQDRITNLKRIREKPESIHLLELHYKNNPIDFINDWGCTVDPRNASKGLPVVIPFILFPKQEDMILWIMESWKAQRPGNLPKSRDMGVSWVAMALSCTLGLFYDNFVAGFGSRKEDLVDSRKDQGSLLWKGRKFLSLLPEEFRGGFDEKRNSSHMLIEIPRTGSIVKGEAGPGIGRGDRTSIHFLDEAAHLADPRSVEAALSDTTDCKIEMSSVNGMDNPFAEHFHSWPDDRIFIFHWRDDPRKDQAWYDKKCSELNPIIIAQELDLDWNSSKEGILIPQEWVQAAIDAHIKLKLPPVGAKIAALDVADKGFDLNAFAGRYGIVLIDLEAWSGKGSNNDIFRTVERAFMKCDDGGFPGFRYDADGLGAGVRGDARVINLQPGRAKSKRWIEPFQGSGEVIDPEREIIKGDGRNTSRTNADFFANRKAQGWWMLRERFKMTYRAVVEGLPFDAAEIISLSSKLRDLPKLCVELSQPTYSINGAGQILVDKAPDGSRSPNYADSTMICYAPSKGAHRGLF